MSNPGLLNMNTKFLIWGYYGFRNTGDDITLDVIINRLKLIFHGCVITVQTNLPIETRKKYEVDTLHILRGNNKKALREKIKIFKAFCKTDVLLLGGGTLLQEYSASDWRSLFYWLKLCLLARMLGKKVCFFGIGIGGIKTKIGKRIMSCIVYISHLLILRERHSMEYLLKLGGNTEKLKLASDLVFLANINNLLKPKTSVPDKIKIGVSVIPYYECIQNNLVKSDKFAKVMAVGLQRVCELYNGELQFVIMQDFLDISDKMYSEKVKQYIEPRYIAETIDYNEDFNITISKISGLDILVGMRLHSLILSLREKIPVVGIAYNDKIRYIMNESGIVEQCIDIDNLTPDKLVYCFGLAFCGRKDFVTNIAPKLHAWRIDAQKSFKYLEDALFV